MLLIDATCFMGMYALQKLSTVWYLNIISCKICTKSSTEGSMISNQHATILLKSFKHKCIFTWHWNMHPRQIAHVIKAWHAKEIKYKGEALKKMKPKKKIFRSLSQWLCHNFQSIDWFKCYSLFTAVWFKAKNSRVDAWEKNADFPLFLWPFPDSQLQHQQMDGAFSKQEKATTGITQI